MGAGKKAEMQKKDVKIQSEETEVKTARTAHVHTHVDEAGHIYMHEHEYQAGLPGGRRHVHTQAEKKAVLNRMAKAIGHMEAVKRMVERDEDCGAVLVQLAAVRSAINNTGKLVLKNHINRCIMEAVEENDQEAIALLDQAIDKFM